VAGVRLQRQKLGDYDSSGRRRPVPLPGTEFDMACDLLVPAIGQITWVEDESLGIHRAATFDVGKAFQLHVPGVFAAGDSVMGPGTVVQSVGHGNLVAQAVDAWIATGEFTEVYVKPKRHDIPQLFNLDDYADARRPVPVMSTPEQRRAEGRHFDEVEMITEERTVQEECKRCLRCDLEWLDRIGEPLP
jgi:NADH-quinone oxidoreductase subunit F